MTIRLRRLFLWLTSLLALAAGLAVVGLYRDTRQARAELQMLRADFSQLARSAKASSPAVTGEARTEHPAAIATPHPKRNSAAILPVDKAPAESVPVNQPVTPEQVEQHTAALEVRVQGLNSAYTQEARDPKWSSTAVDALQQAYAANPQLSALAISSDCRATLCRVDFSFYGVPDGLLAVRSLLEVHPWSGTQFVKIDRVTQQGSVFIAREGFDLPRVDQAPVRRQ
jgi:hypothetical protein